MERSRQAQPRLLAGTVVFLGLPATPRTWRAVSRGRTSSSGGPARPAAARSLGHGEW